MKLNITPRGAWTEGLDFGSRWSDEHFACHTEVRTCKKDESYYNKDGRRLYRKVDNYKLNQTVTDVKSPVAVADREYKCPSCGAILKVSQLMEGCPYCGTKFKTSELYPKVSNFYFNYDIGYKSGRHGKLAWKIIPIAIGAIHLPFLFYSCCMSLMSDRPGGSIGIMLAGLCVALVFGIPGGYCVAYWMDIFKYQNRSDKYTPMTQYKESRAAFEENMKKFSPEFSYEFFASKTVSMIKMLIYSDKPSELAFYNGPALDPAFLDIINVSSLGAVGITKIEIIGEYVVISADVHLEDTYYTKEGQIKVSNDVLHVIMKKNITKPVNFGFNITSLHCPNCAGTYDATKSKICPFCGTSNRIEDVDWSVEYLGR